MTAPEEFEQTLAHYGVPGMKWGRRKIAERAAVKTAKKEAYNKLTPSQKRKKYYEKRNKIIKTVLYAGGSAYVLSTVLGDLPMRALGSGALAAQAARGRRRANKVATDFGATPFIKLQNDSGVWK